MPLAAILLHSLKGLTCKSIRCRIVCFFRSRDLQILGLVDAQWGNAWMNWTSFTNGAIEANYRVRYVYITDYNRTISLGLFCLSKSSMSCAPPSLVPVRTA